MVIKLAQQQSILEVCLFVLTQSTPPSSISIFSGYLHFSNGLLQISTSSENDFQLIVYFPWTMHILKLGQYAIRTQKISTNASARKNFRTKNCPAQNKPSLQIHSTPYFVDELSASHSSFKMCSIWKNHRMFLQASNDKSLQLRRDCRMLVC